MKRHVPYEEAQALICGVVRPVETEQVDLEHCAGRVLAQEVTAREDVPAFDRSPYDGYAFCAQDSRGASETHPVELRILEAIPAGEVSHCPVTAGTAVRVLTGAPIPAGADAVVKQEDIRLEGERILLFHPARSGENIVRAGEDVRAGTSLARPGEIIDPAMLGVLAAQRVREPLVYRRPRVGIITTGSELLDPGQDPVPGKIVDTSRYTLTGALEGLECIPEWIGWAGDEVETIAGLIRRGLQSYDALVMTGGVSVGDYDLTPDAMERAGVEILFRGVDFKPGMACAYGVREGKPVCALSGNPAAALTNFYTIAAPALRRLRGVTDYLPQTLELTLTQGYPKPSPMTRLLRGRLSLAGGQILLEVPEEQGNAVLKSAVGCNAMAVVPAGSGRLEKGTVLKGFLL